MLIPAVAQDMQPAPPESKPDSELNCDEANARQKKYQDINTAKAADLATAKADLAKVETDLATAVTNLKNCNDATFALLGATEADINAFRERLGRIEGRVREMQRMSDDQLAESTTEINALADQLNALRREKISAIPEFYTKIQSLARDIKGLYREKKIKGYTVGTWAENRDCLWNISGRPEIYADPFQWPKIWQANTDQIKNPDIIHPGMVLNVPPAGPKTSEEAKAERMYWRKKHARAAAAAASVAAPATTAPSTETKKSSEAGN